MPDELSEVAALPLYKSCKSGHSIGNIAAMINLGETGQLGGTLHRTEVARTAGIKETDS